MYSPHWLWISHGYEFRDFRPETLGETVASCRPAGADPRPPPLDPQPPPCLIAPVKSPGSPGTSETESPPDDGGPTLPLASPSRRTASRIGDADADLMAGRRTGRDALAPRSALTPRGHDDWRAAARWWLLAFARTRRGRGRRWGDAAPLRGGAPPRPHQSPSLIISQPLVISSSSYSFPQCSPHSPPRYHSRLLRDWVADRFRPTPFRPWCLRVLVAPPVPFPRPHHLAPAPIDSHPPPSGG